MQKTPADGNDRGLLVFQTAVETRYATVINVVGRDAYSEASTAFPKGSKRVSASVPPWKL